MTIHQFYIRGHGWEEKTRALPPSGNPPIDLVTVGLMGCTMSGTVADTLISQHWNVDRIRQAVDRDDLIYWTHDQEEDWRRHGGRPRFERPKVDINIYSTLNMNLCLGGDDRLNNLPKFPNLTQCGVCYWHPESSELKWIASLGHRDAVSLAEILGLLVRMLESDQDSIQLYWTACLDADFWSGSRKGVSFYPNR